MKSHQYEPVFPRFRIEAEINVRIEHRRYLIADAQRCLKGIEDDGTENYWRQCIESDEREIRLLQWILGKDWA